MKQYHPIPAVYGVAYGVPDKSDTDRVNRDSIGRLTPAAIISNIRVFSPNPPLSLANPLTAAIVHPMAPDNTYPLASDYIPVVTQPLIAFLWSTQHAERDP